eukprot:2211830-Amphidinium_carterae.1
MNLATRYLLGAVILSFNEALDEEVASVDRLADVGLLKPQEVDFLKSFLPNRMKTSVLLHWSADIAYKAAERAGAGKSARCKLVNTIIEVIKNQTSLPLPHRICKDCIH